MVKTILRDRIFFGLLSVYLLSLQCLAGQEVPLSRPEMIKGLVEQLGSPRYAERDQATQSLRRRGREALTAVVKAAGSSDPEVASRAWSILRAHNKSGSQALIARMRKEVGQVADADDTFRLLAENLLKPPKPKSSVGARGFFRRPVVEALPAPKLTAEEQAMVAKRDAYDKVVAGIEKQIDRFERKQEESDTPDRHAAAIERMKKQRDRILDLRDKIELPAR